jgi:hypothetical protein
MHTFAKPVSHKSRESSKRHARLPSNSAATANPTAIASHTPDAPQPSFNPQYHPNGIANPQYANAAIHAGTATSSTPRNAETDTTCNPSNN